MKIFRVLALVILAAGCSGAAGPVAEPPQAKAAAVVDGASAKLLQKLPGGLASPDSKRLFWLGSDRLHVTDTASGIEVAAVAIPAGSRLAGLSPAGKWVVVADRGGNGARFSAFDTSYLDRRPAVANLAANFEFDAISDDGRNLFLIERKEQLGAGRYSVTVATLPAGTLCQCTVVDKTEPGTSLMRGTRVMAVPHAANHVVYTLYQGGGHDGAFVHALSLDNPLGAWCVDLPPAPGNLGGWQIGLSASGHDLLAVNLAAGLAASADISKGPNNKPVFGPAVHFPPTAGPGPGRHGLLAAPDGHTLFVLGATSVVELDAISLQPRSQLLATLQPVAIAGSPDGQWQYALTAAGAVARLNPLLSTPEAIATGLEAPLLVVR